MAYSASTIYCLSSMRKDQTLTYLQISMIWLIRDILMRDARCQCDIRAEKSTHLWTTCLVKIYTKVWSYCRYSVDYWSGNRDFEIFITSTGIIHRPLVGKWKDVFSMHSVYDTLVVMRTLFKSRSVLPNKVTPTWVLCYIQNFCVKQIFLCPPGVSVSSESWI